MALLDVQARTLYTYASRGWVRTRKLGGRRKLYARADVEALRARAEAHAGHGARAASALAWGEPVLTTDVSGIDPDGPYYRGVPAVDLVHEPFERVIALLWQEDGQLPAVDAPRADALSDLIPLVAGHDGDAWSLVATLLSAADVPERAAPALVLLAEHGLNASTFAARVVASTGAPMSSCVLAGLAALSGPRHGTAALALAAQLDDPDAQDVLAGFGHPMYPAGDPRGAWLLESFPVDAGLQALIDQQEQAPNIDAGLLALALHLGEPPTRIPLWFAAARCVGWVAHVREQWTRPGILRPRAHYAGWR